ncbi:MAG: sporulation protein YunB [Oscillospiraceae bacterium]|nr:sporulation protein YunB [Oscillospiraceae bacterium]
MSIVRRDRLRLILAVAIVIIVSVTLLYRTRVAPLVDEIAAIMVDNQASNAINDAIQEEIEAGDIAYERMIVLETDAAGNVTAMRSNIGEINRLKTMIVNRVGDKVAEMSVDDIEIPFGNVFLPELFSGRGPKISVSIVAARASDASFRNEFVAAGINQTLHRIVIDVNVTITYLSFTGSRTISVTSSAVAAETIIVGQVPDTYVNVDGIQEVLP